MAIMQWDQKLSVGVARFDDEHVNRLHEAMCSGKGRSVTGATLSELVAYVASHFAAEEAAMAKAGYAALAEHKQEHGKLTAQVREFQERFESGDATINVSLLNFLRDWLVNHILKTDALYASALSLVTA
jgi:hemerythrin-like metal-binding protein